MPKEQGLEIALEQESQEKKIKKWYREIVETLRRDGFEPTPSEAVYLRRLIRECFEENQKIDAFEEQTGKVSWDHLWTFPEIIERFFFHYFGVNVGQHLRLIKPEYQKQERRDVYRYCQEKLRKDREMI